MISEQIQRLKQMMKMKDEIAYAQFGVRKYVSLNEQQKQEVDNLYKLWEEEQKQINLEEASINNVIDDSLYFYKLKEQNKGLIGYRTGLPFKTQDGKSLDDIIQGFIPGKVYTIAGYSNVGKSTFLYYLLTHFLDKKVVFFSTEVNKGLVLQNIVKAANGITFKEALDFIKENMDTVKKVFEDFYIFDTVNHIDTIENIIQKIKPDIAVIDFVQGIKANYNDLYTQNAYIARKVQSMAIEHKLIMLSAAQITATTQKEVKRGEVFSIKGAGEYFESSDVVFYIRRPDRDVPQDIVLDIVKNKFGPLASFDLEALYDTGQYKQREYKF